MQFLIAQATWPVLRSLNGQRLPYWMVQRENVILHLCRMFDRTVLFRSVSRGRCLKGTEVGQAGFKGGEVWGPQEGSLCVLSRRHHVGGNQ